MNVRRILLCGLILTLCFSKKVVAASYFDDDFSSGLGKWTYFDDYGGINSNSWTISNGRLKGEISTRKVNYLYPNITLPLSDYVFEADVENINGVD